MQNNKPNIAVRFIRGVKECLEEIFGEFSSLVFWLLGFAIFAGILKLIAKWS